MSFLQPDPLPAAQKWKAIVTIVIVSPVLLDAFGTVELGDYRIAPFLVLLAVFPFEAAFNKYSRKQNQDG